MSKSVRKRLEVQVEEPECKLGYPREQLERVLGPRLRAFSTWAGAITVGLCDGREYDHEAKQYHPSGCGPHGVVVYRHDVLTFLEGGPNLD